MNLTPNDSSATGISAPRRAPRSRFQPKAAAGMRLEPRDEQLLCDLFLQRMMSRGQIERLYFSSTVRCNARLRQLFDHKFVARFYPPVAPYGAQALYTIGAKAPPVVAKALDMDLTDIRNHLRRSKTPTFVEHTLAIVDLWLAFREEAQRSARWEMERWVPEILCRHEYEIRSSDRRWKEAFKPDGFVRFVRRDRDVFRSYFFEVDLGHTSSRQFAGKIKMHERYLESGLFQRHYGTDSFRTLVVTTGERRLRNLLSLCGESQCHLLRFTTFQSIKEHGVLAPVWYVPDQDEPIPLVD